MAVSTWLAQRNEKARARLMRNLPEVFPEVVLMHALSRPFLPATPRRSVDSYWRYHPIRADKLARALAAPWGAREGGGWRLGIQKSGPLVCVRAAHISVRLASRPLGRPAPKSERYMAQLLRCGLGLMEFAERTFSGPDSSSEEQ